MHSANLHQRVIIRMLYILYRSDNKTIIFGDITSPPPSKKIAAHGHYSDLTVCSVSVDAV